LPRCCSRNGRTHVRGRFQTFRVRVPDEAAGDRLDKFLAELPAIESRSVAERLVEKGAVRVDGSARPKSYRLEGGEELEVELPPEKPKALEREAVDFRVTYEDEHLLVVDKPAGVVVHPGAGHGTGTLVHGLVGVAQGGEEDRPGIVHRLDRDTSGLLVVARSDEAHERLQDLVRDRDDPTKRSLDTDKPRDAVTHFEVAELLPGSALLNVRLETGRTHQIRVHLAAVDLPVVGDRVYGVSDRALGRQFLHANRLAFDHPFTRERVDVESPLPPDLAAYLGRLRGTG
jgi:23S rRNA pseudouridine1911/1915/1917 synthase